MDTTDLFVITSVINTGTVEWTYTNVRSVFTPQERFEQTLQTIDSIKKFSPSSLILLVECSDLNETMTDELKKKVNYFIQAYENLDVRDVCIQSNKKGYGEVKKLELACKFIQTHDINFNRLFKISGRYFLNENFVQENYVTDNFTFMRYSVDSGSTVLYSVPYSLFGTYTSKISDCVRFYENGPAQGLETLIPMMCSPVNLIKTLGVSGYVAVKNDSGGSDFYTA